MSDQASWLTLLGDDLHARITFTSSADGADGWTARSFSLEEEIDGNFVCEVVVSTGDPTVKAAAFKERDVTINVERGQAARPIHGVVSRVRQVKAVDGDRGAVAVLTVVPALELLGRTRKSRIFQEQTVPEILKVVLEAGLKPFDRSVRFDLQGGYAPREFRTQLEESDLDFARRLMEKEGIFYFFEFSPEDGKELLVLADAQTNFLEFEGGQPIRFSAQGESAGISEAVREFEACDEVTANAAVIWDSDWTRPSAEFNA